MAVDDITRVRYFERQYLTAADFNAEQTYERNARRRHVLAHHTWGIVTGLALTETPDGTFADVVLTPGVAIDGFGRELVVVRPERLDPILLDAFHDTAYHQLWIGYEEETSAEAGPGWVDCAPGAATRVTEGWRLVVEPLAPQTDDIMVDGAAIVDPPADTSVPYQELPQAPPGDRWLIFLGLVHWDGTAQRFLPVEPGVAAAAPPRRYAGVVADHLLTPARTLGVRRRFPITTVDEEDFATVEGRLRVQERLNAEMEVWVEGQRVRFTYPGGDEDGVELTLGRERAVTNVLGHDLRLRIGEAGQQATALSIGPGAGADATDVVRVRADDVVSVPTGKVSFAAKTRQMLDLYATSYGIGVQSGTLYLRSGGGFCFYRGGVHDDGQGAPGAGGEKQLELDAHGDLQFGTRRSQLINLWDTGYGLGIQDNTLYARTSFDFSWFRGGVHNDARANPGGGTLAMRLDDTSHLWVGGSISAGADLGAIGSLTVGGTGTFGSTVRVGGDLRVVGQSPSVFKAKCYKFARQNSAAGPVQWTIPVSNDFDQVFEAFAVLGGFSIWANTDPEAFDNYDNLTGGDKVVQHAYVRVVSFTNASVTLRSFCSESDENLQSDNCILGTLVVLGRMNG